MKVLATTVFIVAIASAPAAETPTFANRSPSAEPHAGAMVWLLTGPDFTVVTPRGDPWSAHALPHPAETAPRS
ncbi:MAG: hypothetical protein C0481_00175 [Phenylobacterium sp.]|uniref:hypothetical protein n=1 Tax=Phenylobacterium sp. TaxID=1871053 RepID=UPI0025FC7F5C|nr:hypothetical protein [Phenylobacterium sp.]MBA4010255.1 hypothetical protein [Phenylobacterium sp.]